MNKYLDQQGLSYFWGKIKAELTKLTGLIGGKVDKRDNYDLSKNDFTDDLKSKLEGIPADANAYELPEATNTVLGGVKVGSGINVEDGVISVDEYDVATSDDDGLMSSDDKAKLDEFTKAADYAKKTDLVEYKDATQSESGLMSDTDKAKLDAFGEASTYALKADIVNMYNYQGSVATYADLPKDAKKGDVWDVKQDGMNYAWTGTEWDGLGAVFTITAISTGEIDALVGDNA